jgi:hypothetical protein
MVSGPDETRECLYGVGSVPVDVSVCQDRGCSVF